MGKKICSKCKNRYDENELCPCTNDKTKRNEYQRKYYEENKERQKLLTSARWRKLRLEIIRRDHSLCRRCMIKYTTLNGYDLSVHHIKPRSKYPELMFDPTNLVTLCGTCNRQLGIQEKLDFDFDPNKIEHTL